VQPFERSFESFAAHERPNVVRFYSGVLEQASVGAFGHRNDAALEDVEKGVVSLLETPSHVEARSLVRQRLPQVATELA
jgi:hypothetical protein